MPDLLDFKLKSLQPFFSNTRLT